MSFGTPRQAVPKYANLNHALQSRSKPPLYGCEGSIKGTNADHCSNELSQRYSWTSASYSWIKVIAIRQHCWQYCTCSGPKNPLRNNGKGYQVNSDLIVQTRYDGSMVLLNQKTNKKVGNILRPQGLATIAEDPSEECKPDDTGFCTVPWNTTNWRPPVPGNADLGEPKKAAGASSITQCGNKCQGPQDCRASDTATSCFCAVPGPRDAKNLGLDPIFPPAVCLILNAAVAAINSGLTGKREVDQAALYVDGEGHPARCLCNATYISPACCGSQHGMIHEDMFGKPFYQLADATTLMTNGSEVA